VASKVGHPLRTLVACFIVIAVLYGVMAVTKSWTPRLGLDLSGGTTITLTARNISGKGGVSATSLDQARTIIQQRVDGLGVGESQVTTAGGNQIIVSAPNVQRDELIQQVGQTAELRFRAVYDQQHTTPTSKPGDNSKAGSPSDSGTASAEPSSSPSPRSTATAKSKGNGRPAPALPTEPPAPAAPFPTDKTKAVPADQAINWQPSSDVQSAFASFTCPRDTDTYTDVADKPLFACDEAGTTKYLLGPTVISGNELTSASAGLGQQGSIGWQVDLGLNGKGASQFQNVTGVLATRQSPQNQFAIVLDGTVVSAPYVDKAIPGGQATISGGDMNQQRAQNLANVLRYGQLPLAFEIYSVDTVSASLGGEQLQAGLIAGAVGMALVLIFCFLYYRGLGLVVIASLAVDFGTTYESMVLLGAAVGFALSLAGIAGAIVAIGVTADSFVIYFARIRDEVGEGRTIRTAVETGWRRARQTILVADAVSFLSALILFIVAIGSVRGFAFTLGLTTIIDVVVVFLFTKPLVTLLSRTKFFGGGHKLSGLDARHLGVQALPGNRRRVRAASATAGRSTGSDA
jgi:preprotein translocase subunit SecD